MIYRVYHDHYTIIIIGATIVTMCLIKYHVLLLWFVILKCYALNCRSDGGPREADLKNIYKKCLKMEDGRNSSKENSDQDWKEPMGQFQTNNWGRDRIDNKENGNSRHDRMNNRGKMNSKDDAMRRNDDKTSSDRMGSNDKRMGNGNDRIDNPSDRMGKDNDMMSSNNNDRTGNQGRMDGRNGRHGMETDHNDRYGRDDYYNRDYFSPRRSEERGSSPRRYKREKRPENSGQRSQYNPNNHKATGYEDHFRSDEKNSSENNASKEIDNKACALHCFMENLKMTADDGMPDRYLVTQAITKDVKNDDLKDFLEESIEECFQILNNENTEEKCEFAKNLLMCLSEKGRANCDDWKEDLKF